MGPNEILFFLSSFSLPLCSASRLRLLNAEESFSTQSELSRQFGGELRPLSKLIPKRFHSWRFFFWIAVSVVHLRLAWRNDTVLWNDMTMARLCHATRGLGECPNTVPDIGSDPLPGTSSVRMRIFELTATSPTHTVLLIEPHPLEKPLDFGKCLSLVQCHQQSVWLPSRPGNAGEVTPLQDLRGRILKGYSIQ